MAFGSVPTYADRERWLMRLYRRTDLTPAAKLTGAAIAWHLNFQDGLICPSMDTVAAETALTVRAVRAHVSQLNELGLLGVERRGRSYRYTLGFDTGTAVPLKPKAPQRRVSADSGLAIPVHRSEHWNRGAALAAPIPEPQRSDSGTAVPVDMEAYSAAIAGATVTRQIGARRTAPGTVNAAIVAYYNSEAWALLKQGTRRARRNIFELFREEHGDKRISKLTARPLIAILAKRKSFAARNWLKALRGLCQFCVASDLLAEDPTRDIKLKAPRSEGFHSWDEAQIEQFETRHPVGTRARLALALILWTAQRRGDVVRLGRQHERNGVLGFTQEKTGTYVEIPLFEELRAIIEATPSKHLTYLVTETGKGFTAAGFGNWFADRCKEAALPNKCRAHGLRKAMCRRLAEAGCSAPQISAISGHLSIKEVQRYIEAANRKLLARDGMAKAGLAFSSANAVENNHSQTGGAGLRIEAKKL